MGEDEERVICPVYDPSSDSDLETSLRPRAITDYVT